MSRLDGSALNILTWHIHGTYLQMLGSVDHRIHVAVKDGRPPRFAGLPPGREWPSNLTEVPADEVAGLELDCVLFQSDENWLVDQHEVLTEDQRRLPRLYLEHDPPGHDGDSCFSSRHPVDDPDVRIVHVTHFNDLMWDSGEAPTTVIEHAVPDRGAVYHGGLERGLVVVNNLARRGRRLGRDLYEQVRDEVPLDLVGMGSFEVAGGIGEVPPDELSVFAARYRFFFHPIRYTSLGLALCEAMMMGMPVVALATTEAVTVIEDGVSGFISTDIDHLIDGMHQLLAHPEVAREMGRAARQIALDRFAMSRFAAEWTSLISQTVTGGSLAVLGDGEFDHGRIG
ncbi:MAG TPA: glycosyltransferase [Acidimicrobiia bacterium]|nr:glycosyltransferase [Acidimicrobiia bacterium]